ncbi:MAG: hypothetical protein O2779_01700 [Nanoarchaeota archaeon]|nr:hypothetical protein [Nanoarchaeota archaeon]
MSEEKTLMISVPQGVLERFQLYCAEHGCTPSYRVLQLIEKDMGVGPEPALVENPELQKVAMATDSTSSDPKMVRSGEVVPTINQLRERKSNTRE